MLPPDPPASQVSAQAIETWLKARVAELANVSGAIDAEQPFAEYGLTSMAAVSLTGDLEEWLGRPVPPTLAWDFPNIASLARHLADRTVTPSRD